MAFPVNRPRRLRVNESMRRLVRETHLQPENFILPLFVCPGEGVRREIGSMPGHAQLSIDLAVKECEEALRLGLGGVILFGLPASKDEMGSEGYDPHGIVQRAVRAIKAAAPALLVVTDVCNCEYTSHGHCGKIVGNDVDNDATLEWLAAGALTHAQAGADIVAPSDMMDGRVAAIRRRLDEHGFFNTPTFPTRPNSPPATMGRSARQPSPRRSLATGGAIRWTRPTRARPCARLNSISKKAPT